MGAYGCVTLWQLCRPNSDTQIIFTASTHLARSRQPSTSCSHNMARRDRSYSPDTPHKRVRPSHRSSPRSPSPTRRNPRPPRSRYDDDRDRDRDRERGERDRERGGDRDRYRDDRYRDDRRRDYRDDRRDDRRRSRSRDRRDRDRRAPTPPRAPPAETETTPTAPPVEDDKLKAKRAKLEAWKKEREAKKALDEAKAKAMALAGKSAPRE